jgi:hypothetical protein
MVHALVARTRPLVKVVKTRRSVSIHRHRRAIGKSHLLTCVDANGRAATSRLTLASPHRDHGLIVVRIYVEAVVSRLLHGERLVGRVHFIDFVVIKPAHVQVQRALVQLQLHGVLTDVGQGQAGLGVDAN